MNNKVIIVTGASRGIGACIAETLAVKGYTVIANYNKSEEKAKELQEKLKKENINIDIIKADVVETKEIEVEEKEEHKLPTFMRNKIEEEEKREEVKKLIKFTIEKYKKVDCIINNAGIDQIKMFLDISDEDWNKIIQNNLNSTFYMCQETLPYMIQRKEGLIINISSIWGQTGASCESHYAVAKAGIDALTKSLAKEMGPSNIRVNSIAPGIIDTEMNNNLTEEEKQEIIQEIPLEKIGKKEEIAKCIEWLLNDNYVTGQIIGINGGWLI